MEVLAESSARKGMYRSWKRTFVAAKTSVLGLPTINLGDTLFDKIPPVPSVLPISITPDCGHYKDALSKELPKKLVNVLLLCCEELVCR